MQRGKIFSLFVFYIACDVFVTVVLFSVISDNYMWINLKEREHYRRPMIIFRGYHHFKMSSFFL